MNDFIIFYAPFIVTAISIIVAFLFAGKDELVTKNEAEEEGR